MKYIIAFLFILSVGLISFSEGMPDRFIIRAKGKDIVELEREIRSQGLKIIKPLKNSEGFIVEMPLHTFAMATLTIDGSFEKDVVYSIDSACSRPKPDPPPMPTPIPIPDQPEEEVPYGVTMVGAIAAQAKTRGQGATVCIVDTGIDRTHTDLKDNVIGGADFTGTGDWIDDNGHGSHVAGTVAAVDGNGVGVVGVAPEASLLGMKVLDYTGSGYSSDISDAIRECIKMKADVINLSLGGSQPSPIVQDALKEAQALGIISVCAAGNDSSDVDWPAAFPECHAISAVDSSKQLARFSSRGPEVKYAAPGVGTKSTVPGNRYDTYSGTSMATPHAAGVFALIKSVGKDQMKTEKLGLGSNNEGEGLVRADLSVQ